MSIKPELIKLIAYDLHWFIWCKISKTEDKLQNINSVKKLCKLTNSLSVVEKQTIKSLARASVLINHSNLANEVVNGILHPDATTGRIIVNVYFIKCVCKIFASHQQVKKSIKFVENIQFLIKEKTIERNSLRNVISIASCLTVIIGLVYTLHT